MTRAILALALRARYARPKSLPRFCRTHSFVAERVGFEPSAYCGQVGKVTTDHVPPRSWFPEVVDYELITVPACSPCNQGWAADAEYMRSVLVVDHRSNSNPSARELQSKVIRGFARHGRGGPTADIVGTMREVELRSAAGLFVGTTGAFDPNIDKLEHVCSQIVRGLYWSHAGTRLPETHGVGAYIVAAFTPKNAEQRESIEQLIALGLGGNTRELGDVFKFDYRLMGAGSSAWVMQFYEGFVAIAATLEKAATPHRKLR